jgi:phosphoribosyl-ATP pyrophosphohydrolase
MKSFDQLWLELSQKAASRPAGSKTVAELDAGIHQIGKKIIEEAGEVWLAAEYQSDEQLALEISQLLYHLQVLMLARNISMDQVCKEL